MNRPASDSISRHVRDRIKRGGADRLWTYADFADVPDRMALAAALSRLATEGVVHRVRRGMYYRPRPTIVGPSRPDPNAIADATLRALGETPIPSGLSAWHRLGLTTQVPATITRTTGRRSTRARITSDPAAPLLAARSRPVNARLSIRPEERATLDALRELGDIPDTEPADVLRRIVALCRDRAVRYDRLARLALAEPPRVRALLGAIGDTLHEDGVRVSHSRLAALRASLNPLTAFRIAGAGEVLPTAAEWRIRTAGPARHSA